MNEIIIRKIKEDDIPSVVDIQIDGWKTAYDGIIDDNYLSLMNREERINKMKRNYMQNGFIVAELDGVIVGFCRYVDNNSFSSNIENADCELSALYVQSNLKFNGIGTRLFQYVVEEFKSKKKKKMILWCFKDNEASKRFYEKMGGVIIAEKQTKLGEKDYIEICYCYDL